MVQSVSAFLSVLQKGRFTNVFKLFLVIWIITYFLMD